MRQKFIIAIVLLLSVVAPFAALADSFQINPVNLGPGNSGTLSFTLTNSQDLYGFQAEVKLPAGVTAEKTSDGKLDITLSDRAEGGKEKYIIDSNTLADGTLIMGAVSSTHTPFTGNDGVLLTLKVSAASTYAGGTAEVKNIYFIDSDDKDVKFEATSTKLGVAATEITFTRTTAQLRVGGATTFRPNLTPAEVDDPVTWTSSKPAIATVDDKGNVKALALGETIITATCGAVKATCKVTVVATPAESITLSSATLALKAGETSVLTATVLPDSATNKTVTWKSDNTKVATVDATTGKVTAVDNGTAKITATSASETDVYASCTVTVTVPVTGLEVTDPEGKTLQSGAVIEVHTGDSYDLTGKALPANATDKTVTWTSSNEEVATVDGQGLIETHKAGEATITAAIAGFSFTATVKVTDPVVAVTGVTISRAKAEMKTGETLELTASVTPEDATNKNVTWSSSDKNIATVTATENKCVVKALKAGTVKITASANKIQAVCDITITDIDVTEVTLDAAEKSVVKGETFKLTATVTPEDATHREVTWASSNEKVATVDEEGNVTAAGGGTADITATAGTITATCKVTVTVPVAGLTVLGEELDEDHNHVALENGTTLNLHTGDTYDLTAVVNPSDATDKTVTWTTTDAGVAEVDDNGLIETHKAGEATIKAEIAGYSFEVKLVVTDPIVPITGIKLNRTELEMTVGDDFTLKTTFEPSNASSQEVSWKSSDTTVATVSKTGVVTALKAGTATISATANKISATCNVTVKNPVVEVESITLDKTETTMTAGETLTLVATVNPEDADDKTVTWSSDNEEVATVDQNGKVTALAVGTATIKATVGEKSASCVVTVEAKKIAVESITLNETETTMAVGETKTLEATVEPGDADDATVTWTSSDETIATVDENGEVTALAEGNVTITAKAGGKEASCVITVTKTNGAAALGFDADAPVKVYDMNGIYVADDVDNLRQGLYIIRQGENVRKIRVK